jgi:phosphoglycerate dehydrogenase-like enzyme
MALIVHFYQTRFSDHQDFFESLLDPEIRFNQNKSIPTQAAFEILVHPTPTAEWLEASPNLRAVVVPWAGIPEKTRNVMRNYPNISLHNLHHNNFNTAELGFALLLAAAKHVLPMDHALRNDDWGPRYQPTKAILLRGKTALILGFGEIGQALANYCLGMGMRVIATKRNPDQSDHQWDQNVTVHPPDDLDHLLPSADVLLIALPLTDETENLIDKKQIALMPKGSILINIGRGTIVNQYAFYEALKNGHLRAGGSDVWYNYPDADHDRSSTPSADVPFGELDNFVLSPHRGGMVEGVEKQRAEALAMLLNAANRGDEIPNKVDLNLGY